MTEATAQRLRNALGWLGFPLAGMLCGLTFGILEGKDDTWIAMVYGAGVGGVMIAFAMGRLFPRVSRWLRAQAAPIYVGGTMLVWSALSFVSYAVMGLLLMVADQWFGILAGHQDHGPVMWLVLRFDVLLFSMGVSAVGGLLFRIRDLIGTRVFLALLVGRYHRPTREERIFLLVDVAGWTSTAERLGELGATDYLGQILFTMGSPVRRNRGAIDRYVGDQAIISWNISCGARQAARQAARAITCTFDILEAVERAGFSRTDTGPVSFHGIGSHRMSLRQRPARRTTKAATARTAATRVAIRVMAAPARDNTRTTPRARRACRRARAGGSIRACMRWRRPSAIWAT